jgi:DNA-binding CsgD family transcriptional regulator
MDTVEWSNPAAALAAAASVQQEPLGGILPRLSAVLDTLVPHSTAAELTGFCGHSPLKTAGASDVTESVTSSELSHLAARVAVGAPWRGEAHVGGTSRVVTAVAATTPASGGALLVLTDTPAEPLLETTAALLQSLWDLITAHQLHRALDPEPEQIALSRAAASERQRVTTELTSTHAAALTGLLTTLRARSLDNAAARQAATDLAASALVDLHRYAHSDEGLTDISIRAAFDDMATELRPLRRYGTAQLEFRRPETDRPVPSDIAYAARSTTLSAVLSAFEQDTVERIRISWHLTGTSLSVTIRDDGPGTRSPTSIAAHQTQQIIDAIGGDLTVDAEPSWGTTLTATLPLGAALTTPKSPLENLGPRELDVLAALTRGLSNRAIAEELHIGETTVKFHVANILSKLSVSSRGQAAALARDAGFDARQQS